MAVNARRHSPVFSIYESASVNNVQISFFLLGASFPVYEYYMSTGCFSLIV